MELRAERIVAGGDALAHAADGRVALVDGALPGEVVRVEITSDRADHLRARVVEVVEAAADRVEPPCPHARQGCGGCTWQHIAPAAQPALKVDIVRDALRRIAGTTGPPIAPPVVLPDTGFRTTVRAAVTDGRAAFRKRRSHDPITIESCLVAHPLVDEILRTGRFPGAAEVTVRVGAATGERAVLVDPTSATASTDVPEGVAVGADECVHEEIDGRRLRVSMRSFFQTRADGASALARIVRAAVGPDRSVADLYCGVGLFAASLDTPRAIVAVERNRFAVADAKHNLRDLPARVQRADVERYRGRAVDVVVADPSRAGLGRAGARSVVATKADRVVLVSCDAAALARDARLLHDGGFALQAVTVVDLFPHTPHVECVSVFDRRSDT